MPFKRNFKRRYRRRGYRRAVVSRPVRRYVARALDRNIEDKGTATLMTSNFASVTTTWVEFWCSGWAQGLTGSTRIGRKVQIKSLEINGIYAGGTNETALDDPYNVLRIVVAVFNGNAGTTPLQSTGITINTPIKRDTVRGLVRKYYDKYKPVQVASTEKGGGDGYAPGLRVFKYFKRFKRPLHLVFADDTNNYPSIRLFVSMVSDSVAIPNPGFINGYMIVKYQDA